MKEYKAVPGPREITFDRGNMQTAFDLFSNLINKEARNGWSFHSVQPVTVTEKAGCLHAQSSYLCYMLIFEKETDESNER